jgi:hypothetical protein
MPKRQKKNLRGVSGSALASVKINAPDLDWFDDFDHGIGIEPLDNETLDMQVRAIDGLFGLPDVGRLTPLGEDFEGIDNFVNDAGEGRWMSLDPDVTNPVLGDVYSEFNAASGSPSAGLQSYQFSETSANIIGEPESAETLLDSYHMSEVPSFYGELEQFECEYGLFDHGIPYQGSSTPSIPVLTNGVDSNIDYVSDDFVSELFDWDKYAAAAEEEPEKNFRDDSSDGEDDGFETAEEEWVMV